MTKPKRDQRGFSIYGETKHSYGGTVTVKQSSSAEGDYCWIFIHNEGTQLNQTSASAHLSRAQARRVMVALGKFLEETK